MDSGANAEFRAATEADVDAVLSLAGDFHASEGYPFDAHEAKAVIVRLLREPQRGRIFVIVRGGHIVGYLVLTFGYSIEFHGIDAFVDELYLRPDSRRLGLGKHALEVAEAACIELGIRALHLEVERKNTAAQQLYRTCGYRDHDRYLLTKDLS
jgi:ribosomal protein S18 acetylase RimI-like enzyme